MIDSFISTDSIALIAAVNSILLLVVASSPPEKDLVFSPSIITKPQPPGPGFPLQAPSV